MVTKEEILDALRSVNDPEIPAISIVDLGIVTSVSITRENCVNITLTTTYAGCPAIRFIEKSVRERLESFPVNGIEVRTNFDIQWNSDMITEEGRQKLRKYGLTPPAIHNGYVNIELVSSPECPNCGSKKTVLKNPFGSALCRSMHYCEECMEAFEQFKPV